MPQGEWSCFKGESCSEKLPKQGSKNSVFELSQVESYKRKAFDCQEEPRYFEKVDLNCQVN